MNNFVRRRRVGILVVASVTAALSTVTAPARAADSGTVTATVTPSEPVPCITISRTTAEFLSEPFTAPGAPPSTSATAVIDYKNCGTANQTVLARATDAAGPQGTPTWQLTDGTQLMCELGIDKFRVGSFVSQEPNTNPSEFLLYSTANKTLPGGLQAAGDTNTLLPRLHMPCRGSSGAGVQMQFQMIYTATV